MVRLFLPALLVSCGEKTPPVVPVETDLVAESVQAAMNTEVDPCDDFYQYACGTWLANTTLPSDKPSWTRSFSEIRENNRSFIKDLLERAAADPTASDADWAAMGNLYGACMDTPARDTAGLSGIQHHLDAIDGITDATSLMTVIGSLESEGVTTLAYVWVDGDFQDPTLSILHTGAAGLSLPDRDYYLKDDADSVTLQEAHRAHIGEILGMLGLDKSAERGVAVAALERGFAEAHWPSEELRDPAKTYHKIDREGLVALTPELPWDAWLNAMGANEATDINVSTPEPLQGMAALITKSLADNPEVVRDWLRWQLISSTASHLPAQWYDASFAFYGVQVYGQKESEPQWKRCVDYADGSVGEIIGRFYVEERFPGDSKAIALEMIGGIQDAFEAGLPALSWMDDATRAAAIEKKSLLRNKIGYPDVWRDYSALTVTGEAHTANALAARRFESDRQIIQIGETVDLEEWLMSPPSVNAYYHPIRAEMVFPAGILQPPFFSREHPMAMNFGGIGMVMGHELTHGFDDSGRKFNGHGQMVEWWPEEVATRFDERAQCVVEQFDAFEVAEGLNVNGQLTLGENIADIGGVRESFRAYQAWVAENGAEPERVEGLNNEQLFFVSFAQGWCSVASPEFQKMMVLSNTHSPAEFRVNGPIRNLPEFAETFSCAEGTPMHPEETCEVW
ncbi:MAG: putative endopeptidase [Myxococcota bacterium]|jgi:putative endopeptidase